MGELNTLLEVVERFLRKQSTIGELRQAARRARAEQDATKPAKDPIAEIRRKREALEHGNGSMHHCSPETGKKPCVDGPLKRK